MSLRSRRRRQPKQRPVEPRQQRELAHVRLLVAIAVADAGVATVAPPGRRRRPARDAAAAAAAARRASRHRRRLDRSTVHGSSAHLLNQDRQRVGGFANSIIFFARALVPRSLRGVDDALNCAISKSNVNVRVPFERRHRLLLSFMFQIFLEKPVQRCAGFNRLLAA